MWFGWVLVSIWGGAFTAALLGVIGFITYLRRLEGNQEPAAIMMREAAEAAATEPVEVNQS